MADNQIPAARAKGGRLGLFGPTVHGLPGGTHQDEDRNGNPSSLFQWPPLETPAFVKVGQAAGCGYEQQDARTPAQGFLVPFFSFSSGGGIVTGNEAGPLAAAQENADNQSRRQEYAGDEKRRDLCHIHQFISLWIRIHRLICIMFITMIAYAAANDKRRVRSYSHRS